MLVPIKVGWSRVSSADASASLGGGPDKSWLGIFGILRFQFLQFYLESLNSLLYLKRKSDSLII